MKILVFMFEVSTSYNKENVIIAPSPPPWDAPCKKKIFLSSLINMKIFLNINKEKSVKF